MEIGITHKGMDSLGEFSATGDLAAAPILFALNKLLPGITILFHPEDYQCRILPPSLIGRRKTGTNNLPLEISFKKPLIISAPTSWGICEDKVNQ